MALRSSSFRSSAVQMQFMKRATLANEKADDLLMTHSCRDFERSGISVCLIAPVMASFSLEKYF
jgi:hypothetical protein